MTNERTERSAIQSSASAFRRREDFGRRSPLAPAVGAIRRDWPIDETAYEMNETKQVKQIRVLLVDDQPTVRQGLRMRLHLEPDIEVIGEAATGEHAIEWARELSPDVIIMDVEMPGMGGIAAARRIRAANPNCAVIMSSLYDDTATRALARSAGAIDFVAKQSVDDALLAAIRNAARPAVQESDAP